MKRLATVALCLCLAACTGQVGDVGGGPDDPNAPDAGGSPADKSDAAVDPGDQCGDLRMLPRVYYGTEDPSYVPLQAGQVLAIGTWGSCTGTLIAPTWVLTAEHCGLNPSDQFCIGEAADNADVCFDTVRIIDNPDADMALAELAGDARDALPGVMPIPIMTEPMADGWLGRTAEAAGYGQQEDGGYGVREFTAEPIVSLEGHTLTIDGEGSRGVCFGDSGGPVMVVASDGTVRVAGDLSNGDGNCVGRDNYTRTDTNVAWIEDYTGPTVADGAACGTIDTIGRCMSGGIAMWCGAGDELQSEACAGACGWDAGVGGFRCIEGADSCGGYDRFGGCDGNVARWCDDGAARQRDCSACEEKCVTDRNLGGAYCAPDPCMGLDYLGRCNGDVAEWCSEGQFRSEDCAAQGKTCEYVDDSIGYYCQ